MTKGNLGGGLAVTSRPSGKPRGSIGQALYKARVAMGERRGKKMFVYEMAELLGVPYRTYQDWELGNSKPCAGGMAAIKVKLGDDFNE